jgi:archaemetzincin
MGVQVLPVDSFTREMMQVNGLSIALVPVGDVDQAILSQLRDDLAGIFAADIGIYPAVALGRAHLVKERGQYVADDLLGDLSSIVSGPETVLLGITGVDLFSPGMNFVFGIATTGRALISVVRLRQDPSGGEPVGHQPEGEREGRRPEREPTGRRPGGEPTGRSPGGESPPAVFRRRVLTEAVHELGHALGLSHCEYPGCVMYFSNWIGDTDRKGPGFCFRCARALERLMVSPER